MRRTAITLILTTLFAPAIVFAQSRIFTKDGFDFTFELPSPAWRDVSESDETHRHAELVYGDRMDGYLRVRKELIDANLTLADLARRDQDAKLRYLPAYVAGKQEPFTGRYAGLISTYEYTAAGKPMIGRIYYLQIDNRTTYTLHFTGMRERLQRIRNQTDIISRTFQVK